MLKRIELTKKFHVGIEDRASEIILEKYHTNLTAKIKIICNSSSVFNCAFLTKKYLLEDFHVIEK
jgi:hypothetical protein